MGLIETAETLMGSKALLSVISFDAELPLAYFGNAPAVPIEDFIHKTRISRTNTQKPEPAFLVYRTFRASVIPSGLL